MKLQVNVYDTKGNAHIIECENWEIDKERYVFYIGNKIVAVFQNTGIMGFTVIYKGKE